MSPKLFKEIIGQDKAITFLKRIITGDTIAPAYLFAGTQGIGKTTTAMAFALLINCMDPVDGDGCKRCSSCKKIVDGNHPDLIIIEPDKDKKGIGINQIREINRHLAFSPALERYRIIIVDPAEKMTDEAANAFLKALEEPPPYNIFILNVRDPGELLPTIISRCQKVPFKPLPAEAVVNWLIKEENMDKEKAQIVAKLSEGSLGRAKTLMLNSVINKSSDMLIDLARELSGFRKSSATNKEGNDDTIALMLGIWKSWYRDILLFKLEGKIGHTLNSDLSDHLKNASALYTVDALMRSLAVIARAEHDLMEN
ncbi:MAG: DNA polymerase III subunit delta', partial [Deltaproteobacteria bacterium]|nr:DNA polymerase III subunit delta' [Deltaproteobacteria bacterium]